MEYNQPSQIVKDLNFSTVIDVGSNKGQFIMLIEGLFENKYIYSFEPIKEVLEKQKKLFKYKKNIFFFNHALGSNSTNKNFYITKRIDSSSFLKVRESSKNNNYNIKEKRSISIKALDDVFAKTNLIEPILLKIDVQGYELEVLKGCKNLLKKIKYIIAEVSENQLYIDQPVLDEINNFLIQNNFEKQKENQPTRIKNFDINQKDILFKNKLIND